jgi:hypothetical protein
MISIERALNSISEKTTEELRDFARNRIMGTDVASFGSGHSTEPSEDVVIQLLANPELDPDKRKAVIDGWMFVYREIRAWLDNPNYNDDIDKWKDAVINLCRVVDIAEPQELSKYVKRLITELLDEDSSSGELLGAAVKAYMAYAQDVKSIRFWEEEVLTNKNVAAYGFNALLDIDPKHPRIEEKLGKLWRLQVEDNWPVNTAFLLRRAARVRNEKPLIYRVLLKLKNSDRSLWGKVEKELNQPWSKQWLEKLTDFEPPTHQEVQKKEREKEITIESDKSKTPYADLPCVVFKHGFEPGSVSDYYGLLMIRSHPSNIDWVDDINGYLQMLNIEERLYSSPHAKKESEENAHVSQVG